MAVAFPFEVPLYEKVGLDVRFVGHPLIDAVTVNSSAEDIREKLAVPEGKRVVVLMPGSRGKEIKFLLPPMLESAEIMAERSPEFHFVLPLAHTVNRQLIDEKLACYKVDVSIVEGMTYEVLKVGDLAFIASGTATLEAAILGTPMVVVYKGTTITYLIGSMLVKLPSFSLPNIVADKQIVPELLQDDVNAGRMVEEAFAILYGKDFADDMRRELAGVRKKLGGEGASKRTAELLVEMIGKAPVS
jgi:lipid-A-disaccharide synthase